MAHSRAIGIFDYSCDGAYIFMDDPVGNRLRKYAWPIQGPSKSLIIGETVPKCMILYCAYDFIFCLLMYYSILFYIMLYRLVSCCMSWYDSVGFVLQCII